MSLNVIALGGNAILDKDPSDSGQKAVVAQAAKYIADFVEKGEQVILCHGNGPQVGNLLLQQKAAESEKNPQLKLDTCVAMTQGSIGYWLQHALTNEFAQRDVPQSVISLITQVRVDKNDPSFQKPSKPIGPFYDKEEAEAAMAKTRGCLSRRCRTGLPKSGSFSDATRNRRKRRDQDPSRCRGNHDLCWRWWGTCLSRKSALCWRGSSQ